MIRCPEYKSEHSIYFEGVAILPVFEVFEDNQPMHYWDWDNADIVDERGYFCGDCDASYVDPKDFMVNDVEPSV